MSKLLGHLAPGFRGGFENLATNTLDYILREYGAARAALIDELRKICPFPTDCLRFRAQMGRDGMGIPDMTGFDDAGQVLVVIENKFWANLTTHQPVSYLDRLPPNGGLLLFVAPTYRHAVLWSELCRRAPGNEGGQTVGGFRISRLPSGRKLALTDWTSIIGILKDSSAALNPSFQRDIELLENLLIDMDLKPFRPITASDLEPEIPFQILQYRELVDLAANELAVIQGIKLGDLEEDKQRYGRYLQIGRFNCLLMQSFIHWRDRECTPRTPIWLRVGEMDDPAIPEILRILGDLMPNNEVFNIRNSTGKSEVIVLPIYLPLGSDRTAAVEAIVARVLGIASLLS